MQKGVLDGVDVLDLGQIYNGPYCSMILSYLGANVVKMERPSGEPLRARVEEGEEPAALVMLNSNKRGITLNLKEEEGKELFKDLAEKVDVVVENFSTGTMEKLGLGYETLSELNPEIIYAHGSGYGEYGPYRSYPAMDLTIQAIGGVMDVTGFPDGPPTKAGVAIGDFMGGIHLATGVVSALYHRERTGEGQFVEVSMHDSVYPTLMSPLAAHFEERNTPSRTGNRHSGLAQAPYNVYEVDNGHVAIFCVRTRHWNSLLEVLGREDLLDDPRFETNVKRANNIDAVDSIIQEQIQEYGRDELVDVLLEQGVPCGPVRTLDEVVDDPHLKEREMITEIEHPEFGEITVPGQPIRLSKADLPEIKPSPTKGEDNYEVYEEFLGLSKSELRQLEEEDVI